MDANLVHPAVNPGEAMDTSIFWNSSPISDISDFNSTWSQSSSYSDQENINVGPIPASENTTESTPSAPYYNNTFTVGSSGKRAKRLNRHPNKQIRQRQAANQRERKRMNTINEAFEGLRVRIPLATGERKLSKVDTLRLAIRYIQDLTEMVETSSLANGENENLESGADKIIIRCHSQEYNPFDQSYPDMYPVYGHSLSWEDNKEMKFLSNHRLRAKIWLPENPNSTEREKLAVHPTQQSSKQDLNNKMDLL